MRESSPPEATLASGRGVVPAWPATRNSTDSTPNDCGASVGDELDLEAAAGHAELLHRSRHRGGELRRRRAARRRDAARLGVVGGARRVARALERVEVGGGVELLQLGLPLLQQRRQIGGRTAMAPRQRHPGGEPLLDLAQTGGIELGAIEVAGQRVRRVLQLRLRALQRFDRPGEARVELGDVLERVDGAAGERVGARVGFGDRVEREPRGVEQRLAVREAGVLGVELGPFVGAGRELGDLADLPGEPLALALEVALLLARRAPATASPRARPTRARRAARRRSARARRAGRAPRARASGPCQACWPWMSTSRSAASRSCAIVAPLPLIHARLLPWRVDRPAQQHAAGVAGVGVEAGVGEPGRERRRDVELGARPRRAPRLRARRRRRRGCRARAGARRRGSTCRRRSRRSAPTSPTRTRSRARRR